MLLELILGKFCLNLGYFPHCDVVTRERRLLLGTNNSKNRVRVSLGEGTCAASLPTKSIGLKNICVGSTLPPLNRCLFVRN